MSVHLKIPYCLLRLPEVKRRVGLSRSSIYAKVQRAEFPAPIGLGGRAVAWLEIDVDTWIGDRVRESRPEMIDLTTT